MGATVAITIGDTGKYRSMRYRPAAAHAAPTPTSTACLRMAFFTGPDRDATTGSGYPISGCAARRAHRVALNRNSDRERYASYFTPIPTCTMSVNR
ncbi:Uncharacterised protein [Mycobacteroides abscessus subsp. abscessus]|nr:Uncharacterised protein [Mycobacteroides abscessus subsp. abscessus]